MFEVELKVRNDHEAVRAALADIGAELEDPRGQKDTYFNAPHRDFASTDEALRTRRETTLTDPDKDDIAATVEAATAEGPATLTYKGPRIDETTKTREEVETEVQDGTVLETILEELGFESVATVTKVRETAELDEYTVALDSVAGVGDFVEVERTVAEGEIEAARSGARDCLRELGLDPAASIRTSYLELLLDS